MSKLVKEDRVEGVISIEDFCKDYNLPLIMKAFRRQRDFFNNEVTDFIRKMMDKIS